MADHLAAARHRGGRIPRNPWADKIGMGGRIKSETVDASARNTQVGPAIALLGLAVMAGIIRQALAGGKRARLQMKALRRVTLRTTRPVNAEAYKTVFLPLEDYLKKSLPTHRLFAEVAMGGFIQATSNGRKTDAKAGHAAYNAKRVDFLVIDSAGNPALVVEYQRSGHYRGDAIHRDKVKREALRMAGIPMIEIAAKESGRNVISACAAVLNPSGS